MKRGTMSRQLHTDLVGYSFMLPSLVGLLFFSMIPLLFSLYVSLTDWNYLKGIGNWRFIGLDNFISLWTDEWFLAALKNTVVFTVVTVPISLLLSVVLASLLENFCAGRLANTLRIAMYMPNICNVVATAAVWMMMFSSYGPFTLLVKSLGWTNPPMWLADYDWALPAVMLVSIWSSLGYRVFIYSAAMQGLPQELYEAASIDGASKFRQFRHLTLPLLAPTTFFLTITGIIGSFKVFGTINVMTKGGPGHSTYTMVYYIYRTAFSYYRMGYASSVAVILFIMMLIITVFQWNHNKKRELSM
ncbi:sugar ABC transporter permease [Eubacteriales bacterium OttesenSCG-928-A19]|nr:sugar ABC transporter permease [Eubacteriales bacterium OttesenSCG-928-A19]